MNTIIVRPRNKGLTLVEALVSFALIVIVVISLTASLSQSMVFSKRIDTFYISSYLAQRRMDLLKRFDFDELPTAALESGIRVASDGTVDPDGEYMRTTEVEEDFDGNPYLIRVKVTVRRIKINIDGSIVDPKTGQVSFMPNPVIMETLFADVE